MRSNPGDLSITRHDDGFPHVKDWPVSRSLDESLAYIGLRKCECGRCDYMRSKSSSQMQDGHMGHSSDGICLQCKKDRHFSFGKVRDKWQPFDSADPRYGPPGTVSEILDPGDWLRIYERTAAGLPRLWRPVLPARRFGAQIATGLTRSALDEVLRFIPDGEDEVPVHLRETEWGEHYMAKHPEWFTRRWLNDAYAHYQKLFERYGPSS